MKPLKDVFIPQNFMDVLPELKGKSFAWKMDFSSKTNVATTGHITHYEIKNASSRGNFVLVPGLASNTNIEPLMCATTYWALSHKYNIYALDTFLGDFQHEYTDELAKKNTLPEFMDLMDAGLEIIEKMSVGAWTCVVGHSLGGAGTLEVFNRRVQQQKPIGFSGAILFAPFVVREWNDFTKWFMKHYQYPDTPAEEYYVSPIGLMSPHDLDITKENRYVSVYPSFFDDLSNLKPRPDLMAQYNIPVTMVAGGKDRKSPAENMRKIYQDVNAYAPVAKMRFVEFPDSRHSFINQHNDWTSILHLIKSQHTRSAKK
jgi:dienelactone hydrolase